MKVNVWRFLIYYLLFVAVWNILNHLLLVKFQLLDVVSLQIYVTIRQIIFGLITVAIFYKMIVFNNHFIVQRDNDYANLYIDNPNPYYIYDQTTMRFLSVNNITTQAYGYTFDEFLNLQLQDIYLPEDLHKLSDTFNTESGWQKSAGMWRQVRKDRSVFYAKITFRNIKFNGKAAVMVLTVDITSQVMYEQRLEQMNEALQKNNSHLKATEQLAKISGWEYSLSTQKLLWADNIFTKVDLSTGAGSQQYLDFLNAVHPADRTLYTEALGKLINEGLDMNVIFRLYSKSSNILYINALGKMEHVDNVFVRAHGTLQDVTDYHRLVREKDKYLGRLNNTLENISDGFYFINKNWIITEVNFNCETLLGVRREDMINQHYSAIFPNAVQSEFYQYYKTVLESRKMVKFEGYQHHLNRWFAVKAHPTENGGAAIYFSDITEAKQKDILLKEALARYDLVAKATNDVIYDWDIKQNKISYRQNLAELLKLAEQDFNDLDIMWRQSHIHPDDLELIKKEFDRAISLKENNVKVEYRMRTAESDYIYVLDKAYMRYNNQGNLIRMIGAITNIDDLKRTTDENRRLASIVTRVNNMILIQNASNDITFVNKAFESFTGFSMADIIGRLPHHILSGPETDFDTTKQVLEAKKNHQFFNCEIINYNSKREKYWVKIDFTPIFTPEGNFDGYICIHTDITANKIKQEKINHQNQILKHIAWTSSHEVRRPVASILGLIDLITTTDCEQEKSQSIEMIDVCARQLDEIIHKINRSIEQELSDI